MAQLEGSDIVRKGTLMESFSNPLFGSVGRSGGGLYVVNFWENNKGLGFEGIIIVRHCDSENDSALRMTMVQRWRM